jgi:hypothetical protein
VQSEFEMSRFDFGVSGSRSIATASERPRAQDRNS